ncbi:hypothetical protein FNO01nite_26340 [Flavobacterium noncentrifugens]|uniref:Uncharacterized protein n=1 Tax=Flavobacterium noncentrifugens TaxID=1128970 RepID=A0A1G8ZF85_9FLAO|nr:hypothetical protein [Flavobacterium noncentrifugens]GEP51962.1 hypothetical protein FNO01nite_26340 [Flavobacterium noncentrifugens]SDK13697.1 hypothetical protein SAMN04487935_2565 [Flavobacterium noncentrifugens]
MVYFSDFFQVDENVLENYGALNISLINDLPLFIDPFLLFDTDNGKYSNLHSEILKYLSFLKDKSERGNVTEAQKKSWYYFSEVKQNWLGFSVTGNGGSGLGKKFADAMSGNMHKVFSDLNQESVSSTTHIEKVCLFDIGVGKDNISDFTCNLIKKFFLEYTEKFAKDFLKPSQIKKITIKKAYFEYNFQRWMSKQYDLPFINNDFVILTPKNILSKDDNWINTNDLRVNFTGICGTIPNDQLRSEIQDFYNRQLPAPTPVGKGKNQKMKLPNQQEVAEAVAETIERFPQILNYYIKIKEGEKDRAKSLSEQRVADIIEIFKTNVRDLISTLLSQSDFYNVPIPDSYSESMKRIEFMRDVIENKDGYRLFYHKNEPLKRESDVQVIFRLTWYSSPYDVNREVNNGRGPVDFAISRGSSDKTLIEFKLASNSKLKMNLANQVKIYEDANNTKKSIKVILYFDNPELQRVNKILDELELQNDINIILIDASGNKESESNVR